MGRPLLISNIPIRNIIFIPYRTYRRRSSYKSLLLNFLFLRTVLFYVSFFPSIFYQKFYIGFVNQFSTYQKLVFVLFGNQNVRSRFISVKSFLNFSFSLHFLLQFPILMLLHQHLIFLLQFLFPQTPSLIILSLLRLSFINSFMKNSFRTIYLLLQWRSIFESLLLLLSFIFMNQFLSIPFLIFLDERRVSIFLIL